MNFQRGAVIVGAFPGDLKKPRPAIILQSDAFIVDHLTLLTCPLTTFASESRLFRPVIEPDDANGLRDRSEAMMDKLTPLKKSAIGSRIGMLSERDLLAVEVALLTITGLSRLLAR